MIKMDSRRYELKVNGKEVYIAPKEWGILEALMNADGAVITREGLMNKVWPLGAVTETRTVDQHIARLRGKLGKAGSCIITVPTRGYKFKA